MQAHCFALANMGNKNILFILKLFIERIRKNILILKLHGTSAEFYKAVQLCFCKLNFNCQIVFGILRYPYKRKGWYVQIIEASSFPYYAGNI